jgi:hypothetical protein
MAEQVLFYRLQRGEVDHRRIPGFDLYPPKDPADHAGSLFGVKG